MYESNYGGSDGGPAAAEVRTDKDGFLERMRKMPSLFAKGRIMGLINVEQGAEPLLLADHEGSSSSAPIGGQRPRT